MKIIVDANIVFSGILNTNGKIADILINSGSQFNFIAPNFLKEEIRKHYARLSKTSGLSGEQIKDAELQVCKGIKFISEEQITFSAWAEAHRLVFDIDPKDTPYIAYAKYFKCKLWSGDKTLIKGLEKKGFTQFIFTNELYKIKR